jgi:hypothetical protein
MSRLFRTQSPPERCGMCSTAKRGAPPKNYNRRLHNLRLSFRPLPRCPRSPNADRRSGSASNLELMGLSYAHDLKVKHCRRATGVFKGSVCKGSVCIGCGDRPECRVLRHLVIPEIWCLSRLSTPDENRGFSKGSRERNGEEGVKCGGGKGALVSE